MYTKFQSSKFWKKFVEFKYSSLPYSSDFEKNSANLEPSWFGSMKVKTTVKNKQIETRSNQI